MSVPKEKVIRSPDFAKRLSTACETNPLAPPQNYGRLTWLKRQLHEKFNETVSVETVRKWFSGEAKPKPDKLKFIAQILEVDEAWLSLGLQPDLTPREQRARNATADGAVNLVAGLVQMGGGYPAFPAEGDKRAMTDHVDLYAIIKGAQYAFHVTLAQNDGATYLFSVPTNHSAAMQIGVIPGADLSFRLIEIADEAIEGGTRRGGVIEVAMSEDDVEQHRIRNFSRRM